MYYLYFVTLYTCIHYTSSAFSAMNHKPKSPCESSMQNSLIEQFFNIIFSEFHNTPPVCVCVQMCAGQSTYCYPNGCLKKDDVKRVDRQQPQQVHTDINRFMFVVDEQNDFMKDFFEKSYNDDSKKVHSTKPDMRPELFKDKYSMLVKYKKMPSVKLKYNLREQVKNVKSDQLKVENSDLSKTRWPLNKRNLVSGHQQSKVQKRAPLVGKTNFFMSMLPANDYAEYSQKYAKRDITNTQNGGDTITKAIYLYENPDNATDRTETAISLETLIDNLIKNSFKTNLDLPVDLEKNEQSEFNVSDTENGKNKTQIDVRASDGVNRTLSSNETVNVISMNLTNEKVDKNKYVDDSVFINKNKFNKMIVNLSKRIEKQNNTSMEIAKRVVSNFDEFDANGTIDTKIFNNETESTLTYNSTMKIDKEIADHETKSTTPANLRDIVVTKKNRQRRAKKSQNGKSNSL